jgi:two-component system sensor histidine kinase BarA
MDLYFEQFEHLLHSLPENNGNLPKDFKAKLVKVFIGMQVCRKKMKNATHFIDYFVHDILDYTILNQNSQNFQPNNEVFDIKKSVQHIIEI